MRPLIVGEAPNRTGDPRRPLEGRIGQRLATLCALDVQTFRRRFDRVNLLDAWPGRAGEKGARFDQRAARLAARRVRRRFRGRRVVLLLGKRVAAAFGVRSAYLAVRPLAGAIAAVLPHPSGVNRWYNDPANRAALRQFLKAIISRTWQNSAEPAGLRGPFRRMTEPSKDAGRPACAGRRRRVRQI